MQAAEDILQYCLSPETFFSEINLVVNEIIKIHNGNFI